MFWTLGQCLQIGVAANAGNFVGAWVDRVDASAIAVLLQETQWSAVRPIEVGRRSNERYGIRREQGFGERDHDYFGDFGGRWGKRRPNTPSAIRLRIISFEPPAICQPRDLRKQYSTRESTE